jgi:hypothetical protein
VNGPPLRRAEINRAAKKRLADYQRAARSPNAPATLSRAISELHALIWDMEDRRPIVVQFGEILPGARLDLGEMRREIAAQFQARFDAIRV